VPSFKISVIAVRTHQQWTDFCKTHNLGTLGRGGVLRFPANPNPAEPPPRPRPLFSTNLAAPSHQHARYNVPSELATDLGTGDPHSAAPLHFHPSQLSNRPSYHPDFFSGTQEPGREERELSPSMQRSESLMDVDVQQMEVAGEVKQVPTMVPDDQPNDEQDEDEEDDLGEFIGEVFDGDGLLPEPTDELASPTSPMGPSAPHLSHPSSPTTAPNPAPGPSRVQAGSSLHPIYVDLTNSDDDDMHIDGSDAATVQLPSPSEANPPSSRKRKGKARKNVREDTGERRAPREAQDVENASWVSEDIFHLTNISNSFLQEGDLAEKIKVNVRLARLNRYRGDLNWGLDTVGEHARDGALADEESWGRIGSELFDVLELQMHTHQKKVQELENKVKVWRTQEEAAKRQREGRSEDDRN
jgi:hypothetical protein